MEIINLYPQSLMPIKQILQNGVDRHIKINGNLFCVRDGELWTDYLKSMPIPSEASFKGVDDTKVALVNIPPNILALISVSWMGDRW